MKPMHENLDAVRVEKALLWATPEGNLVADDPRQKKLELKAVPEQTRKVVSLNK